MSDFQRDTSTPAPLFTGNVMPADIVDALNTLAASLNSNLGAGGAPVIASSLQSLGPAAISGLTTTGSLKVGTGTKTGTAAAGAVTLNQPSGIVTSEALVTAAGATYTLTITTSSSFSTSQAWASCALGTATTGLPCVATVKASSGSIVVVVQNIHASQAFNGTITVTFLTYTA